LHQKFTDKDFAVTVDSLGEMRDQVKSKGLAVPNVEAALKKFNSWARPEGCEFLVLTGADMHAYLGAINDPDYDEAKYQAALHEEG
jgi:hypothetical protein